MKKTVLPFSAASVAVVILFAIAVSLASGGQLAHARPEPSPVSSQALFDAFEEASATRSDRAMQIASQLWERREDIPQRDLVSAVADTSRSRDSRELMVDLLAGPPEAARVTNAVRDLLRDSRLDPEIKARVVARYEFGPEDSTLLSSLAADNEDIVAFHALKKLGAADPSAARQLALAALREPEKCSDSRLSAAYKVLIRSGTLRSDHEARRLLLRHLASVIGDAKASQRLQDSAAFALADLRSLDALRTLLESKTTDRILLVGAIDQNALLIKTALERDPDDVTIELAVTAMELYPIREIAEPLAAARDGVASPVLCRRLDAALARIAKDGVPLNIKWTEDGRG